MSEQITETYAGADSVENVHGGGHTQIYEYLNIFLRCCKGIPR